MALGKTAFPIATGAADRVGLGSGAGAATGFGCLVLGAALTHRKRMSRRSGRWRRCRRGGWRWRSRCLGAAFGLAELIPFHAIERSGSFGCLVLSAALTHRKPVGCRGGQWRGSRRWRSRCLGAAFGLAELVPFHAIERAGSFGRLVLCATLMHRQRMSYVTLKRDDAKNRGRTDSDVTHDLRLPLR